MKRYGYTKADPSTTGGEWLVWEECTVCGSKKLVARFEFKYDAEAWCISKNASVACGVKS